MNCKICFYWTYDNYNGEWYCLLKNPCEMREILDIVYDTVDDVIEKHNVKDTELLDLREYLEEIMTKASYLLKERLHE